MRLKHGTLPWLVAHDLRLGLRGLSDILADASPRRVLVILVAGAILIHLIAWPISLSIGQLLHGRAQNALALSTILGGIFTWMLAHSLFSTSRALFDRGDLDLLLGSPLPPRRIMAAKALSIMASTLGSVAILLVPLANAGALADSPLWLGCYPVLLAFALIAASIGVGLAVGLFYLFGPMRARSWSQLAGAVLGGGFVLAAQIYAILPHATQWAIEEWLRTSGIGGSALGMLLGLPASALRGEVPAMVALVAGGVLLFLATTRLLGDRFAAAALAAAGTPSAPMRAGRDRRIRFRAGIARALRLKEWRLLTRDPSLFAQLSLQIIYTVPVIVIVLRSDVVPPAIALVPAIVLIAAQVTGSIAWLTVSGEDAPELIATAPVEEISVARAKLSAVALPMLAILAGPLAGLAYLSFRAALLAFVFAGAAGASTALLNFWHPMPGNRRGMLRRHQQSKLIGILEHGLAVLWALAAIFALYLSPLALIPLLAIVSILLVVRARHRRRQADGGSAIRRSMGGALPAAVAVPALPAADA